MKYLFAFKEIYYGCIKIEDDHKPDCDEIIGGILGGMANYNETDFTDFHLAEIDGNLQLKADEKTNSHNSFNATITEKPQTVVAMKASSLAEA